MKTKLLLLFLCIYSLTYAQLEQVVGASFGTFKPLFQYQGNLYVNQIYNNPDTQGEDYRYFKINVATNVATQLTVTESAAPYFVNGWWVSENNNDSMNPIFNPQYYETDVYFHIAVGSQLIVKIDTQNNVIDMIDSSAQGVGVQRFHDRLFYGYDTHNGYIDLLNGSIVPIENPLVRYDTSTSFVAGSDMFFQYRNSEGNNHFSKFNEYYAFESENDFYLGDFLLSGFYPKHKPIFVNDRLIYRRNYGDEEKIVSFSIEDLENNLNILDATTNGIQDYLVLPDGAIFHTVNYDVETGTFNYKWYKTDGVNNAIDITNYMPTPEGQVQYVNLNSLFQTYSDWNSFIVNSMGNSFVKIGNTVYFTTLESLLSNYAVKLYKMTSINTPPELIHTFTGLNSNSNIRYATEWQGNLVFYNEQENVIYTYNGAELYIDPILNTFNCPTCRTIQEEDVEITGIFTGENYFLVNTAEDGLFKIKEATGGTDYTITTKSSPVAGGTTTGGGSYASGSSVTVKATPASDYLFESWKQGSTVVSTTKNYTFTVSANATLTAVFKKKTFTITTKSSPAVGGTTTGGGVHQIGKNLTVKATAAADYVFESWKEGTTVISTTPNFTFIVSGNRTLTAVFKKKTFTITTKSSPAVGGTTTGGGVHQIGKNLTVKATAAADYVFESWKEGTTVVSTTPNFTFIVSGNRTLTAVFKKKTFTITTKSTPVAGGTTTGGGVYQVGKNVTVKATAASGYVFESWLQGTTVVSTNKNYSFIVESNKNLKAKFVKSGNARINASANFADAGIVNGGGDYEPGSNVNVSVTPNQDYTFVGWLVNGELVSTDQNYSFTAEQDTELIAYFEKPDSNVSTKIQIYPNPFNDFVLIDTADSMIESIELYDLSGRLIYQKSVNQMSKYQLDTKGIVKGSYLLRAITDKGVKSVKVYKK